MLYTDVMRLLTFARYVQNISQEALAARVGTHRSQLAKWERYETYQKSTTGKNRLTRFPAKNLFDWANALGYKLILVEDSYETKEGEEIFDIRIRRTERTTS